MDVRCERCATVYEFDDAQVGPSGVTVKCAQCGNLFKVRRKSSDGKTLVEGPTLRPPATPAPAPTPPPAPAFGASPKTPPPIGLTQPPSPPVVPPPKPTAPVAAVAPVASVALATPTAHTSPANPPPQLPPATASGAYEFWTVKLSGTGEVFRFREMTTLQQWIVERKVSREDAISRTGDVWRKLGTIPELDPFFNIVDRALQAGGMPKAQPEEPTVTANYEHKKPAKSATEASLLGDMGGPIAFGKSPDVGSTEPVHRAPKRAPWAALVAVVLVVGLVGVGVVVLQKRNHGDKQQAIVTQARQLYALDTDDSFRQAAGMLTRVHAADDNNPQAAATLAEIKATWASYLREEARALEQTPAAATAAQSFRREAQAHLDEAKKAAADALAASPDAPEVNRAMALTLCVDGSPVPEVERYLKRSLDKTPADANLVWVEALLAQREGRTDEAKQKFAQANQLALSTTSKPLLRASVALAKLAIAGKQLDDAQRLLKSVLDTNPQHERAKTLLSSATAAPTVTPVAAPAPSPAAPAAPPGTPATPVPTPPGATGGGTPAAAGGSPGEKEMPNSVEKLVAQAEKLLEHGRTAEARKLYEKALTLDPRNVEALTGLGYADLDKERFMSAVDNFKKALEVVPDYGEAIIGMAESYKVRGDREKAVEYYQRYIKVLPGGPKVSMAKANLRDLQGTPKPEPKPDSTPAPPGEAKPEKSEPKAEAKPSE